MYACMHVCMCVCFGWLVLFCSVLSLSLSLSQAQARARVLPAFSSFRPFLLGDWPFLLGFVFFWGGLALPSWEFGPSLSLTPKVFFLNHSFKNTNKNAIVIDIGEGQQWNRARRIHPKSRALHFSPVITRPPFLRKRDQLRILALDLHRCPAVRHPNSRGPREAGACTEESPFPFALSPGRPRGGCQRRGPKNEQPRLRNPRPVARAAPEEQEKKGLTRAGRFSEQLRLEMGNGFPDGCPTGFSLPRSSREPLKHGATCALCSLGFSSPPPWRPRSAELWTSHGRVAAEAPRSEYPAIAWFARWRNNPSSS